jgi:hypothetical protein
MNRSSKGFGLAGVLATVVLLIVAAMFSASAKSQSFESNNYISEIPSSVIALKD